MPTGRGARNRPGQAAAEENISTIRARGGPFVEAVEATRMPMVVSDPAVADNPIIYANAAFLEMSGYTRDDVLGQSYLFFLKDPDAEDVTRRIEAAMSARREITEDVRFQRRDGRIIWVAALVNPVVENDAVIRHFASFIDVTERVERERSLRETNEMLDRRVAARTRRLQDAKDRLEEEVERRRRTEAVLRDALAEREEGLRMRDFLVREVNHRTKNAFQLATSLLELQATRSEPEVRDALATAIRRLARIGEVHSLLTYHGERPDTIEIAPYLLRLCQDMAEALIAAPGQIDIDVEADEEAAWGPDLVIPLGLIVGEALTNALKYAFPEGRRGRVAVDLGFAGGGMARLRIEDDGIGLPASRRGGSLGLTLIETLARQIHGRATVEARRGGQGTAVLVTFPDPGHPSGPS